MSRSRGPGRAAVAGALALAAVLGLWGCRRDAPRESDDSSPAGDPTGPDAADGPGPVVASDSGRVRGIVRGQVHAFLGIPYAAAPVGERRFAPPAPPPTWDGVREATEFGSVCPQVGLMGRVVGDEDCLNLDIWTPAAASDTPRPVLVFFHGGANLLGSGADPLLNGRHLAETQGVIVVNVDYRLGLLGFLAHPELTARAGTSGNWAYLDLIAALEWVSRNIAAFGGDPRKVTIAGESAGALAVCVLMASPLADGLFHAAILQSGGCDVAPLEQREREGRELARAAGCGDHPAETSVGSGPGPDPIQCLRELPVDRLVELAPANVHDISDWALPIAGAVDGHVLPRSPWDAFAAGTHNVVPTLVGSNANETELFVAKSLDGCEGYELEVRELFSEPVDEIFAAYPCLDYYSGRYAFVHATTDAVFTCSARRILRALAPAAEARGVPLFRYWYTHIRTDPAVHELRAYHGAELQLVFGTLRKLPHELADDERRLARIMQAAWVGLATTGSPIQPATPTWEPYAVERDNAVVFDLAVAASDGVGTGHCDLWDRRRLEHAGRL